VLCEARSHVLRLRCCTHPSEHGLCTVWMGADCGHASTSHPTLSNCIPAMPGRVRGISKAAQSTQSAAKPATAEAAAASVAAARHSTPQHLTAPPHLQLALPQMRIALARLLLSDAGQAATGRNSGGLLLLDEPTNHLDSAACKWLANFLRNSSGSMIIVSHDEALLEVCSWSQARPPRRGQDLP
jgi:hypothetical protein